MARNRNKTAKNTDNTVENLEGTMTENTQQDENMAGAELDAIEAALNAETTDVAASEDGETVVELDDETIDAVSTEIDAKEAAYDKDDGSETVDIDGAETEGASESEGEEAAATPRKRVAVTKLPFDEAMRKIFEDEPAVFDSEQGELDETALEDVIAGVKQKKVQDKVLNLLTTVPQGTDPSVYTKIALDLMVSAVDDGNPVTSKDIVAAYRAKYSQGTAQSQAGQMMSLFPALGIARKADRGVLVPNENSVLLDVYRSR